MVIVSDTVHQERWYTTGIDDDTLLAVSDTGYTNDMLSLEWLKHFERFSAQRQHGLYRLLLLDGYGSHCTREFLDFCDNHGIIPFCPPPHTAHILQLLDGVVFRPYKHFHAEKIDAATCTWYSDFNKLEFLAALTSIGAAGHSARRRAGPPQTPAEGEYPPEGVEEGAAAAATSP